MTAGSVSSLSRLARLVAVLTPIVALAGCGPGGTGQAPPVQQLPLVPGAKIVAQARQCDRGANSFCALELVVVDSQFKSSDDLVTAEHRLVHSVGWRGVTADTGDERAAESPGHKYRVTYATASGDLKGVDVGWIHRSRKIAIALSRALFAHSSTMSVLLEAGES
jgi:hypothetical protein